MIEVRVRDHGLGIPPEQVDLIFERFVRLDRDVASNVIGTGLGAGDLPGVRQGDGRRDLGDERGRRGRGHDDALYPAARA